MNFVLIGNGAMGKITERIIVERGDRVTAMVMRPEDLKKHNGFGHAIRLDGTGHTILPEEGYRMNSLSDSENRIDALIDFSHHSNIKGIFDWINDGRQGTPVVIATTGFQPEEEDYIDKIAGMSPLIQCSNFSFGVNLLLELVEKAALAIGDRADIEIVEKHHNKKLDAPSGTALMLAKATRRNPLCGRNGLGMRGEEIGIHSVRGGTIFGEHSVIFAMDDEVIELKHTAYSKRIFAKGAVEAASRLVGKPVGRYDYKSLVVPETLW
ncbi:MAG: 4-hydroxy-tetrahydrodipicolinate reductase [Eubacteriaceae bacterium]|nr:4-hydroxy-tetrahydrodipicolinate reductase [Eubacteriaceae bacterium]